MPVAKRESEPHACPFADKVGVSSRVNGNDHIEGRFSRLETEVESLGGRFDAMDHRFDVMENNIASGFRSLEAKSENRGTAGAANKLTWILIATTVVAGVVGAMTTIFYQALGTVQGSLDKGLVGISAGVDDTKKNLAVANTRELEYREAKGASDAKATAVGVTLRDFVALYEVRHNELSDKQIKIIEDIAAVKARQNINEDRIRTLVEQRLETLHDFERREMYREIPNIGPAEKANIVPSEGKAKLP